MAVLTDLASAEVKLKTNKLYGTTLTLPTLMSSDGVASGYVCDVNIGPLDPTGTINQYSNKKQGFLTGLPGGGPKDFQLDDALPGHVDTTLRNVPIARNNSDLRYADVGSPVTVVKTDAGYWEITGFSIQQPGTHKLYPVNMDDMTIDTVIDLSITTQLLTLAELGELQPFGALSLGATAIYEGDRLVRVT